MKIAIAIAVWAVLAFGILYLNHKIHQRNRCKDCE